MYINLQFCSVSTVADRRRLSSSCRRCLYLHGTAV